MRYEEMLPHQIEETLAHTPLAFIPWGALEWHSRHLANPVEVLRNE